MASYCNAVAHAKIWITLFRKIEPIILLWVIFVQYIWLWRLPAQKNTNLLKNFDLFPYNSRNILQHVQKEDITYYIVIANKYKYINHMSDTNITVPHSWDTNL